MRCARAEAHFLLDLHSIIMHDKTMETRSISDLLRERRKALGLSLSDVARRAGTSAATLSRYENGWTRFETYTLRKLASALECELSIEFRPRRERRAATTPRMAVARLKRLFWDYNLTPGDFRKRSVWVTERVLEYGSLDDVRMLVQVMGRAEFMSAAAAAERVSPRTRSFWKQVLELEGIPCTRKYSRNTAWNS